MRRLTNMPVVPSNMTQRIAAGQSPDRADVIVTSQTTPMAASAASWSQDHPVRSQGESVPPDSWSVNVPFQDLSAQRPRLSRAAR